jgi:Bifunctional DNA primase/polymerase, N-terminal
MSKWSEQALDLVLRFNCFIIPVSPDGLPISKLSPELHPDLPADRLPSQDQAIIQQWATRWDAYGVVPKENFLIIDIDVKDGQNGRQSLEFMRKYGFPEDAYTVKSPSGGRHIYLHKPTHYKPSQGAGHRVLFDDPETQSEWDTLQVPFTSTGVDTRFGNGYVVGPGSVTNKGSYTVLHDMDLGDMPLDMRVGVKSVIKASHGKMGDKVVSNRNNNALAFTMDLKRRNLPDDMVRSLIEMKLADYVGDDKPDFDTMWSMYERASSKMPEDILKGLLDDLVYMVRSESVYSVSKNSQYTIQALKSQYKNQMVWVGDGDKGRMINPADLYLSSPERSSVEGMVFDPRYPTGIFRGTISSGYGNDQCDYYNTFVQPRFVHADDTPLGVAMYEACMSTLDNVATKREDREWILKWFGALIMDPTYRPTWHLHIYSSVRGSGKDTLASIFSTLYGKTNSSSLNVDVFGAAFNGSLFSAGLGILSDFTPVPPHKSSVVLSSFKQITGTDIFSKNLKFAEGVQSPIHIRFVFLSNDERDFPIDQGDRRVYKCECEALSKLHPKAAALSHAFISPKSVPKLVLQKHGFNGITQEDIDCTRWKLYETIRDCGWEDMYHQEDCPITETKTEVIDRSTDMVIQAFKNDVECMAPIFNIDVITAETLKCWIDRHGFKYADKPKHLLKTLKNAGLICNVITWADVEHTYPIRAQNRLFSVRYDKDSDMIIKNGSKTTAQSIYAIRNFETYKNPDRQIYTIENPPMENLPGHHVRIKEQMDSIIGVNLQLKTVHVEETVDELY